MSDGGKGSSPRPFSVEYKQYENNWDLIFGKKKKESQTEVKEVTENNKDQKE